MSAEHGSLGRGRGRGILTGDTSSHGTSSSTSGRTAAHSDGADSNGNGNGNGKSRYGLKPYRTRPDNVESKEGTSGTKVILSANYFKVVKKPTSQFSLYRVDFEPDIGDERLRKIFVSRQREYLGTNIFDGGHMIYMTRRLPELEREFDITDTVTERQYKMKVKFTQTIADTDFMALMIYNTMLRRAMDGLKMQLVGRNLYDPNQKVSLDQYRVELWPGFITSIRQHEKDILTCVEVSHKVMRQETVYDILRTCRQEDEHNWRDNFKKEVIGTIVLTDYNNKTYKVDDVEFGASPQDTFKQKDREVSYFDYYQARWNKVIRDRKQPMLVSNPTARDRRAGRVEPIWLVPELCRATGLTDRMRSNFQMMRAMADHTQMDPENRRRRIHTLTRRLYETPACFSTLENFDMDLDKQIVQFQGRALNQETILFGNGKSSQNDDRVDWTNPMKSNEMFQNVPLKRWALIYPKKCARDAEQFWHLMREVSNGMRYDVADPKITEMNDDRTATYVSTLQALISKEPKMIVIVVPNNAADRYAAIKKITCVDNAIPTQVIVQKTMMPKKGNMGGVKSIATKVMIQINCKLGGAPWMIKFPLKGTMTIGFDVTHDTRDRSKAFGAFVASMDLQKEVAYYSSAIPHSDGNELSNNMDIQLVKAMKQFKDTHGSLPERIFFYRDGVGDGQIDHVDKTELRMIKEKLKSLYGRHGDGKEPMFTFFIVSKRLNTRIFLNQGSRVMNPNSGTVVDNTITLPERFDFFLVSQSVRQGTVAPTSYNIIYDTSGLNPDKLQMISYKQTHLYYNWSGCTRVPAVVQYAHKLAMLAGQSLHQAPSASWNNQLYFL